MTLRDLVTLVWLRRWLDNRLWNADQVRCVREMNARVREDEFTATEDRLRREAYAVTRRMIERERAEECKWDEIVRQLEAIRNLPEFHGDRRLAL